jgi:hypothetical protein
MFEFKPGISGTISAQRKNYRQNRAVAQCAKAQPESVCKNNHANMKKINADGKKI